MFIAKRLYVLLDMQLFVQLILGTVTRILANIYLGYTTSKVILVTTN
jgi:hypothetical protein